MWLRSIKEVLHLNDTIELEINYVQDKYKDKYQLLHLKAKNVFIMKSATTSIIKCTHRYNLYRLRDLMINSNIIGSECLQCSATEK